MRGTPMDRAGDRDGGTRGTQPDDYASRVSRAFKLRQGAHVPEVLQSEASECGLACLAMIAGYYGRHENLSALRQRFPLSLKGMTLARLIEIAATIGMSARPLRLELDELEQLQKPCILHWDLDHFVVLQAVHANEVVVVDPSVGQRRFSLAQTSRHFTGVALELHPNAVFERKRREAGPSFRDLTGRIHGLGRGLATLFGLAMTLEIFALLAPQFMQMVIDQVLADGDRDLLTFLGISFSLLLLMQTAVSALRTWTAMWLGNHFNLHWTGNVFQHLLKLPQAYFMKRHLGDVVSRFSAVGVIQQTVTTQFVGVILDGLMSILTLVLMSFYSLELTAVAAAGIGLYALLRTLYYRVLRDSNLSQITASAKQQSAFMESVRGVQTLRLHGKGPSRAARYMNATTDVLNTSTAVQRLNLAFSSVHGVVSGMQRIGVLWLGAWLAMKGRFSAGMLMAFVAYADQFAARASSLVDYAVQLRLLRLQGERLADIVLTPPEAHVEGAYAGSDPTPSIRCEEVGFRYAEGEPWVLRQFSMAIEPGESVVVTGPSGCGKSTLVRLMLGLLDPQEGRILIGGIDLQQLGKRRYRSMVGSVLQDDQLFSGSIADNIAFFDDQATLERIEQAARLAGIHDDIAAMPMGYRSLVGDMGAALSGGQQQRLFLARALYREPQILILDEATSHLDAEMERHVLKQLDRLKITRIHIAHRAETIASAKRTVHLPFCFPSMSSSRAD